MIREVRLWWRLRPVLERFQELTKMKFSVNVVIQMLALAAQGINATQDLLPPRGKFWAMVALSACPGPHRGAGPLRQSGRHTGRSALHQEVKRDLPR
jgi:hypothetical protein